MDFFIDTEFIERGRDIPLQLVSIGIVSEDGYSLYAVNQDCLTNVVRHPWLSINVVPMLPIKDDSHGGPTMIVSWDAEHPDYGAVAPLDTIAAFVYDFLTKHAGDTGIKLWADFGAYDHVVFCQLWGTMNELPAGIPMYTNEFRTLLQMFDDVKLPPQPANQHHALADAQWLKEAYEAVLQA